VGVLCSDARRIPDFIDINIGDITGVVGFVEGEAVRDVSWCLHLHHCKDGGVVMAANRGVLNTQQPSEAGGGDGEPLSVPELKWQLFEGEANDISVCESERVVTTVVRTDSYQ
jgi:hypothetical protein